MFSDIDESISTLRSADIVERRDDRQNYFTQPIESDNSAPALGDFYGIDEREQCNADRFYFSHPIVPLNQHFQCEEIDYVS